MGKAEIPNETTRRSPLLWRSATARSPSTRAMIENSAAVVRAPASAIGQSTTAQCLRISCAFDPATLAAAGLDKENRLAGVLFQWFL